MILTKLERDEFLQLPVSLKTSTGRTYFKHVELDHIDGDKDRLCLGYYPLKDRASSANPLIYIEDHRSRIFKRVKGKVDELIRMEVII
ncbi:MAG: hypothetical protein HRT47_01690 [Candidatus Caenarcaniphilales bacterium]|nr:hypothetical protein [Candidatus Caenarcaniphilales bacterium]